MQDSGNIPKTDSIPEVGKTSGYYIRAYRNDPTDKTLKFICAALMVEVVKRWEEIEDDPNEKGLGVDILNDVNAKWHAFASGVQDNIARDGFEESVKGIDPKLWQIWKDVEYGRRNV